MSTKALIIRGHQGVGKTTLAERISIDYGICRVSKDEFYLPFLNETRDHKLASRLAYVAVHSLLLANAQSGLSFVVEAPFNSPLSAETLSSDLQAHGILAKNVLLICSDTELWETRLRTRSQGATPNHQLGSLEEIMYYRGSLESEPMNGEMVLDSATVPVHVLAGRCIQYLEGES